MRVGFVGLGKLGTPVALAVSLAGHDVMGYDIDRSRMQNRIWCEAAVCGNRMRVSRHRRGPAAADARA